MVSNFSFYFFNENFHNSCSLASIIMNIALFELITISITRSKKVNGIINPRRACAARVTVVVLCVCLSVCLQLFSDYRLLGGL